MNAVLMWGQSKSENQIRFIEKIIEQETRKNNQNGSILDCSFACHTGSSVRLREDLEEMQEKSGTVVSRACVEELVQSNQSNSAKW